MIANKSLQTADFEQTLFKNLKKGEEGGDRKRALT